MVTLLEESFLPLEVHEAGSMVKDPSLLAWRVKERVMLRLPLKLKLFLDLPRTEKPLKEGALKSSIVPWTV